MEKMNKEQLIEWFIEKYGEHLLLAEFISKEEIRQILNENIKEVTYNSELGTSAASYNSDNKTINVDFEHAFFEKYKEQSIVHEILHALTYSYSKEEYQKDGLMVKKNGDFSQENVKTWNSINDTEKGGLWKELGRGLNEGITDWLTEELTGERHHGYLREKITTKLLFEVIGKENILKKYFDREYVQQIHDGFTFEDFFREEIEAKYQNREVAKKVNEAMVNLVALQDILTILGHLYNGELEKLPEQNKKMYDMAQKQLIEVANDLIQIAFRELLSSQEISIAKKIEFIEMIDSGDFTIMCDDYKEIETLLFHTEETSTIPINYRMYLYSKIAGCDEVEQFCFREGMLNEANFSKSDMLEDFLKAMKIARISHGDADSRCNMSLSEVEYKKIGNHYELVVKTDDSGLKYLLEEKRYDGKTGERLPYSSNRIVENEEKELIYEGSDVNTEQLKKIKDQVERINAEANNKCYMIEMVGTDIIMWFNIEDENGKMQRRNYTIGEDGILKIAQEEETRRLTDDMTKLDIQLMEEIGKAGVSTTQIRQVSNAMKSTLRTKENEKANEKGDD